MTRTLSNRSGYLTGTDAGAPLDTAVDYVSSQVDVLGLATTDLSDYEVRTVHESSSSGATRIYLRQTAQGLPLYNGELQVNVSRDGQIISVNNGFLRDLAGSINTTAPTLTAAEAAARAADQVGTTAGPEAASSARLMFLAIQTGNARLVWNLQIEMPAEHHYYDFNVDAVTGQIWTRFDWVASDGEFMVYPLPVESPNHTTPVPPADARVLVSDPSDNVASPLGWHDDGTTSYTNMRGNNVHAYDDRNSSDSPPAVEPDCGVTLSCNFPLDLSNAPSTYVPAAVTNLFYWNNIIHDIQYQYGFDEVGGNFQVNNFGKGGAGNDDVRAEAQDGLGTCNAYFSTPGDGSRPRMEMFICANASPTRDGDFDNSVIVHEYGHGISNRTVGGPANVSCLGNSQQMGEGWSDWLGMVYTATAADAATDARGLGTYLFGQSANGGGIRPAPYSTDFSVNAYTYSDISTQAIPHGVGFVWATALWEAYWEVVGEHGFDPDLYNAMGGAGNQRMMLYVQEGMANTACSPTFLDARDGVIQAATDNFGGEDVCRLWDAFARRGLGTDATTSGSGSTTATDGSAIPVACQCSPNPTANAGPDQLICLGTSATVGTAAQPSNTYLWSPDGETTAQITVSPTVDTTYTVTATTAECGSASDSATVSVTVNGSTVGLSEDFDSGATGWTTSGLWHLANSSLCGDTAPTSPPTTMYYGQDTGCTYNTGSTTVGSLTSPVITGNDFTSVLTFNYWRQVESWPQSYDVTQVDIINVDTAAKTTVFHRDSIDTSLASWQSSGPISLAAFDGVNIQIEFTFNSGDNISNSYAGWFIDDVEVTSSFSCSTCTDDDGDGVCNDVDNCLNEPNVNQIDTNEDGYGNRCDPDINNDGVVGGPDFFPFVSTYGNFCEDPGYDEDVDLNSDCAIGGPDFLYFKTYYQSPPGPSGYSCAGTVPCP